jgi:hypothetical protein
MLRLVVSLFTTTGINRFNIFSKTMAEDDVRDLFKEFGQIEDCSILRENGKSKGKNWQLIWIIIIALI